MLNIVVRVNAQQANAALAATTGQVAAMQKGSFSLANTLGTAGTHLGTFAGHLQRVGKNLQWTGQQLSYNFTLPLVLAGAAATKWALENETAMTGVRKVYGDASMSVEEINHDMKELAVSFRLLSDRFGVHQAEVIGIGEAWAQAGVHGVALARATRLTLEAMIIGQMDAAQATQGLIAVQGSYELSTVQLRDALAQMNEIENQTSISMSGLIEVVTRAGGSARTAGIDIAHLAAMAAALVPRAGTAAQAGNALRTMISRILVPTKQAAEVLGQLGINVYDASWQAKNGVQRIESMAVAFDGLTQSQKAVVSSLVASRWQINKFDVLMGDMAKALDGNVKTLSTYETALKGVDKSTKDSAGNIAYLSHYVRELNTYLKSNPQRFKIMTTMIQNALADAIIPMLPAIIALLHRVVRLAEAFEKLSPATQQWIMGMLVLLALVGPVVKYIGSSLTLFSVLFSVISYGFKVFSWGIKGIGIFGKVMGSIARISYFGIAAGLKAIGRAAMELPNALRFLSVMAGKGFQAVQLFYARTMLVFSVILARLEMILTGLPTAIAGIWTRFSMFMVGLPSAISNAWAALGTLISQIPVFASSIWTTFTTWMAGLPEAIGAVWAALGTFIAGIPAAITATWAGLPVWLIALIAAALAAMIYIFRRQIADAINWIEKSWWRLPEAIFNVMKAVINVISTAVKIAVRWLSYLNPFARHSPSLVDQVTAGVDAIAKQYARLANIGNVFRRAIADMTAFKNATVSFTNALAALELQQRRVAVAWVSGKAGLAAFDKMNASVIALEGELSKLQIQITDQSRVVAVWEAKLKAANVALDAAQAKLEMLSKAASAAHDRLSAAQAKLDKLSNTGIKGQHAMSDAIFENEMAQKRLRLEMLKMEEVSGSYEDIATQISKISGEIERLQSIYGELRYAGAGSDILGPLQGQIDALKAQRSALDSSAPSSNPLAEMQKQYEKLQKQAEILELQNSVTFDPLLRQIDEVINASEEMDFDTLIQAIRDQKEEVKNLTQAAEDADDAVAAQQATVDKLTEARDALQLTYDKEQEKLDALKEAYNNIEDQISSMKTEMENFGSSAESAMEKAKSAAETAASSTKAALDSMSEGMKQFNAAALGDFPVPGGTGFADEVGTLEDFNKQMQDELDKMMKEMGELDMFKPIKDAWNKAWQWIKEKVGPYTRPVWDALKRWWGAVASWWDGLRLDPGKWFKDHMTPSGIWDDLKTAATTSFGFIKTEAGNAVDWIGTKFKELAFSIPGVQAFCLMVGTIFSAMGAFINLVLTGIGIGFSILESVFITPIAKKIQEAFDTYVKPSFEWFKSVAITILQTFASVMEIWWLVRIKPIFWIMDWVIRNVVVKAWEFFSTSVADFLGDVNTEVQGWWTDVKGIFDLCKQYIDAELIPKFNDFKVTAETVFDAAKTKAQEWWEDSKFYWDLAIDYLDQKLGPAFEDLRKGVGAAFDGIWEKTQTIFTNVKDHIKKSINSAIDVINLLISGINAISELLGGHITIRPVPYLPSDPVPAMHLGFAAGGRIDPTATKVGSGFATNLPRAIVGEGSPLHKEFVVPTDPKYRGRALSLHGQLSKELGIPQFAAGGILPFDLPDIPTPAEIADRIRDIGSGLASKLREGIVTATFAPFLKAADSMIGAIKTPVVKDMINYLKNTVYNWAKGTNDEVDKALKEVTSLTPNATGLNPEFLRRFNEYNAARGNKFTITSGWRSYAKQVELWEKSDKTGHSVARPGTSMHEKGLAIDHSPNSTAADRVVANDFRLYYPMSWEPWHVQPFAMGGTLPPELWDMFGATKLNKRMSMEMAQMMSKNLFTKQIDGSLANGGRLIHRPGGALLQVAEKSDEHVQILPVSKDDKKGPTINIYGNLEFPNIKNGDDAKAFIRNLENMAG